MAPHRPDTERADILIEGDTIAAVGGGLCEAGSFSGAAHELLVAQLSLSPQIQALEKQLGAALLERGRHGSALIAAGRVFLPQARASLAALESGRRSVADLVQGIIGELHVLTIRSVASGVLPSGMVRWHDRYPGGPTYS